MKKKSSRKAKSSKAVKPYTRPKTVKPKPEPVSPEQLYDKAKALTAQYSYRLEALGEGMSAICYLSCDCLHPRIILDDNKRCAYELADERGCLNNVRAGDIDMASLAGLSSECLQRVRERDFGYYSRVYNYEGGLALVRWQLNPDGRYWADEDGYGMTSDKEVNIYGVIDEECRVVVPFRLLDEHTSAADLTAIARGESLGE